MYTNIFTHTPEYIRSLKEFRRSQDDCLTVWWWGGGSARWLGIGLEGKFTCKQDIAGCHSISNLFSRLLIGELNRFI